MNRARRMQRISDLAEFTQRKVTERATESRRRQNEHETQLEQFRAYRAEYEKALTEGQSATTAAHLCEVRRFLAQLEQTITVLEQQAVRAAEQCERDLQLWRSGKRRVDALNSIRDQAVQSARHEDETRSQRELDERTGQDCAASRVSK